MNSTPINPYSLRRLPEGLHVISYLLTIGIARDDFVSLW